MRQRPIAERVDPVPVIGLVPRFYLGAIFGIAAYSKIFSAHGYVAAVTAFLTGPKVASAPAWYASFLSTAVIPHVQVWAAVVTGGEALLGIGFVFGLLTRFCAAGAIYMLVNYMFATGVAIWDPTSHDAPDIVLAFVVLMTGPGRVFGLDALLDR